MPHCRDSWGSSGCGGRLHGGSRSGGDSADRHHVHFVGVGATGIRFERGAQHQVRDPVAVEVRERAGRNRGLSLGLAKFLGFLPLRERKHRNARALEESGFAFVDQHIGLFGRTGKGADGLEQVGHGLVVGHLPAEGGLAQVMQGDADHLLGRVDHGDAAVLELAGVLGLEQQVQAVARHPR